MAKNINYIASIAKGSSRIIGESQNDWQTIRPGSFIRFQEDSAPYSITSINDFFYIKDFSTEDGLDLTVEEDSEINLIKNDLLTITYKEWKATNVSKVLDGGSGYSVEDILVAKGGKLSINVFDNTRFPAKVKVGKVSKDGAIKSVSLLDNGKYLSYPESDEFIGEKEGGAKIKLIYDLSPERLSCEREVSKITNSQDQSTIRLNYQLPKGVKVGKLSVKKQEILISAPYTNESKVEKICNITRDFTPNYNFALVSPSTQSALMNLEVAHNDLVQKLDNKIKSLEEKIESIEFLQNRN